MTIIESSGKDWLALRNAYPTVPEKRLRELIGYRIDGNGVIRSPGKFEGEMYYVPIFWGIGMEGFADGDYGENGFRFRITAEDRKKYPGLTGRSLRLIQRSDGFVCEV